MQGFEIGCVKTEIEDHVRAVWKILRRPQPKAWSPQTAMDPVDIPRTGN